MLNILLSIICYDIWFYLSHILLHKRRFYHYHKEHHEYPVPTFLETYKGHWIEGPFQGLGLFVPCFFLPYSLFLCRNWNLSFICKSAWNDAT